MGSEGILLLAALGLLFALSGTFSGSETALFSLDRVEIRRFEGSPSARERLIGRILKRPERLLAGILLGNTLVNVASSSVAVALAHRIGGLWREDTLVVVAVLTDTLLLLFLGEILPKGVAVQWPAAVAKFYVPVLYPLLRLIQPAALLLERVARETLRALGVSVGGAAGFGRPELQLLFEDIRGTKGFTEDEGEIVANVFDFFETRAWQIMTPRVDIQGIEVGAPRETLPRRVVEAKHSRLPVYRESLDRIIGFVNTKEFLLDPHLPMEDLLKPVHFVPERARVHGVFGEVQRRKLNMVVVVNEYGGTSGIITKEDLIEEIVGEIFDEQERDQEPELHQVGESVWRVDGLLSLTDLAEAMDVELEPGPAPTVAGHVAHLLGRPPRVQDTVVDGEVSYRVLQAARHRARRIEVRVRARPDPGEESP